MLRRAVGLGANRPDTAIPGTGDPDHLAANVAAGAIRLTAEDVTLLDNLHQRGPEPPR